MTLLECCICVYAFSAGSFVTWFAFFLFENRFYIKVNLHIIAAITLSILSAGMYTCTVTWTIDDEEFEFKI